MKCIDICTYESVREYVHVPVNHTCIHNNVYISILMCRNSIWVVWVCLKSGIPQVMATKNNSRFDKNHRIWGANSGQLYPIFNLGHWKFECVDIFVI